MNFRTFVPWLAMLMVYNLAIAAVVMFFMVHCGTVADVVNGYRMSSPPDRRAPDLEGVARMNAGTESATHGHRMTRIAADSDAVFAEAIGRGVLSEHSCDSNFVGYYMYMFHDADGAAWFKHRDTRAYVTMGPAPCKGAAPCKGRAPCKVVAREADQP